MRQFALLAKKNKTNNKQKNKNTTQNEAPGLDSRDPIDFCDAPGLHELIHDTAEGAGVPEQGGNVAKHNHRLWVVGDGADRVFDFLESVGVHRPRTLTCLRVLQFKILNVEVLPWVGPGLLRRPAGGKGLRSEGGRGVLVAMFGDDWLFCLERDDFSRYGHFLALCADEAHLDAADLRNPECLMTEGLEVEVRSQVPVEASQDIEVELCGDSRAVVVSALQNRRILLEIEADDQATGPLGAEPGRHQGPHDLHELDSGWGVKITDGRARIENDDTRRDPPRLVLREWRGEVGAGRQHLQSGRGSGYPMGCCHEMRARDVDG